MPSILAMYDCMPCGDKCESRWFCYGSTCMRKEKAAVPVQAQSPLPVPGAPIDFQLLLPWTGDNND